MKRIIICFMLIGLLTGAVLSGCAKPAPTLTPTPTPTPAAKIKLAFGSVPSTMSGYAINVSLVDYLNRNTNLDITILGMGPQIITKSIATGETQFGSQTPTWFVGAYYAIADQKGNPRQTAIRSMVRTREMPKAIWTIPKTGLTSLAQLKGKTLPNFTAQSNLGYWAFIRAYGVDVEKDAKLVTFPDFGTAQTELGLGRLDVNYGAALGAAFAQLKEAAGGVVLFPIEANKWDTAAQWSEEISMGMSIPGFVYPGQTPGIDIDKPVPTFVDPMVLIANKNLDDNIVYTIVKTLLANPAAVKGLHRDYSAFSVEKAAPLLKVPYHPGAIKALKEFGLWTAEHEKLQTELLKQEATLK